MQGVAKTCVDGSQCPCPHQTGHVPLPGSEMRMGPHGPQQKLEPPATSPVSPHPPPPAPHRHRLDAQVAASASSRTPDQCPLWLGDSYSPFKVQLKGHLLQEACVGTGDTRADKINWMLALRSILDPSHSSVSDSDCGLGFQSFWC